MTTRRQVSNENTQLFEELLGEWDLLNTVTNVREDDFWTTFTFEVDEREEELVDGLLESEELN